MKNRKFGFAIIGCGAVAEVHAKAILKIPNAKLVGVGVNNQSLEKAYAFADKYDCKVYTDFSELLRDDQIHIVNICTPSGLHADQAILCAKAKKHIIIEKPMAITQKQINELICAVEENNVKVEIVSQFRNCYSVKMLKKAIDEGWLGKIYTVDYRLKYYRTPEYYSCSNWRGTFNMDGGGALMNQGIHGIDIIQYLFGDIQSVYATCKTLGRNIEVEDTANVLLEYKSGAMGVIQCTTLAKPGFEREIEVCAENGCVTICEDIIKVWDIDGIDKPKIGQLNVNISQINGYTEDYHKEQFIDIIDCINDNKKPFVDVYEGKKAVEIILAIYKSSKTKKKILI